MVLITKYFFLSEFQIHFVEKAMELWEASDVIHTIWTKANNS